MPRLFSSSDQTNSFFALPKPLKFPVMVGILIASLTALITLIMYSGLPLEIPLFYSLPEESQHLAPRHFLFLVPSFSFGILITHTLVSKTIYDFDKTSALIFAWLSNIAIGMGLFIIARLIYIL